MSTNRGSQGTALITGASSGIGAVYADLLAPNYGRAIPSTKELIASLESNKT